VFGVDDVVVIGGSVVISGGVDIGGVDVDVDGDGDVVGVVCFVCLSIHHAKFGLCGGNDG